MLQFDFINIAILFSLGIHAALITVLVQYGRKQVGGRAYLRAVLAIVGWIIPMIFFRGLPTEELFWVRLLYAMASFTSTTFFLFTLQFPENKPTKWWIASLVALENAAILAFVFHPSLFITSVTPIANGEDIIHFTKLYPIYSAHISLFFLAGFVVLFRKMRRQKDALVKRQVAVILIGYFIASNLAMTTNLILPQFGYFELNWLGQIFSTFVAIFTTYAIVRHRFLNTKVITTEVFAIILAFVLFVQLAFSSNMRDFIIRLVAFIGVVIVEILLIQSVIEEVKRREEMEQLTFKLEEAYAKLKEVDQAKTDFLSLASHQLRSPLTVIKVGLGALLDGVFGPVRAIKQRDAMKTIVDSADRLVNLIGEYLDISRIELGKMEYHIVPGDMGKLVSTLVGEYVQRAQVKGLKLVYEAKEKLPLIAFDEDKMRQVITNLIDNAIKYTPTGNIIVKCSQETLDGAPAFSVAVTDSGRGLSKEDMGLIFQKFKRASGKNMRMRDGEPVEGSGLGLHVAKMFVEAHKGKIWAHSSGLGKGSTFKFALPITSKS